MKTVLVVLALVTVICRPVASAQATPAAPPAQVTPAAPPAISGILVIPATCLFYDVTSTLPGSRQAATLAVSAGTNPTNNQSAADCNQGTLTFNPAISLTSNLPAINLGNAVLQVWTADDSQKQFNFLRAEVKSTIETVVTDKIVKSDVIQASVSRALEDKQTLQEAITAVVNKQLETLKEDIVKEVLLKLQQKPNAPQATQTPAQ
jgi:hypothetical protein